MKRVKNLNYFVVSGWMVNALGIKGNELLIYAIIYGFTQDSENWFSGSKSYLAAFIGVKELKTVHNILTSLVKKGLLLKDTKTLENNTLLVRYKAVVPKTLETWNWLENKQEIQDF